MGLPGSGKTTFARQLVTLLGDVVWLNADDVREAYNDWDFSTDGRMRQAHRLRSLADASDKVVVCDFIAALRAQREVFDADLTIWMDTIARGRFEDTNAAFEPPDDADVRITAWTTANTK